MKPTYRYSATVVRVKDGDTFEARIDLGFHVAVHVPVRIRNLWAPELHDQGGLLAKDALLNMMLNQDVVIESFKDTHSFERWVCDVWVGDESVAALMVKAGHGTAERQT